jgi:hypothetical protein
MGLSSEILEPRLLLLNARKRVPNEKILSSPMRCKFKYRRVMLAYTLLWHSAEYSYCE